MEVIDSWYDGINNFKKHTYSKEPNQKKYHYNLEIIDQDIDESKSIVDVFYDHIKNKRTNKVEMLYSGGVDSEFVLQCLLSLKVPTVVMTMRLMFNGCPLNTHDLYYSEKFCREHNLTQKFVDLDVVNFYEKEYLDYLKPYNISFFHIASHFWLLSKCDYFPIIGGNHTWPWTENNKVLSPLRYQNNMHDRFMKDNNINGIGNMMLFSYESNYLITKRQLELSRKNTSMNYGGDPTRIILTKKHLYESLHPEIKIEPRIQTYGWENVLPVFFNKQKHDLMLANLFGSISCSITWGKKIAGIIGGNPGTNDKHW